MKWMLVHVYGHIGPRRELIEFLAKNAAVYFHDRPELEKLIGRVQTALQDHKWDEVTKASNDLADTLFYLEDV